MERRSSVIVLAALAAIVPLHARGQCAPLPGPLVAANPATAGYVARYNALVARDPYLLKEGMGPGWRDYVALLKRDPAVPPDLMARAQMMLARSLQGDDGVDEALAAAREARRIAEQNGLGRSTLHAEIMTTLAMKENNAGKAQAAVEDADAGLAEAERTFPARSWPVGYALMTVSAVYAGYGRFADAEPFAARAEELALACLPPDDPRIVHRIGSHGAVLGMAGRTQDALGESERAAILVTAHPPPEVETTLYVLDGYGWDLRIAGRFRESEAVLRYAIDLAARRAPTNWYRRASLLGKFGNLLDAEGKHEAAEAVWLQAIDYHHKTTDLSNPLTGSGELRRAADAAEERGDLLLALTRREAAVTLMAAHAQPRHPELARARIEYAHTLALAGRTGEARAMAEPAVAVLTATMPAADFKRLGAEMAYARIVAAADGFPAADALAQPVATRLETLLLDTATSRGDLIRFAPAFSNSFASAARFALGDGHDEEAFRNLQLANLSDVVLVRAEIVARAAATDPAARALVEQLQGEVANRQQLDRQRARATTAKDAGQLAKLTASIRDNDATIAATTAQLDRVFPAYRAIGRPTPVPLDAFRAGLGADDVLIAPLSLPGETVTIAVTREGMSYAATPGLRARTTALIARLRRSIDAGRRDPRTRFDVAAARGLGAILLPDALAPVLRAHRHVIYYTTGALATIPPSLLIAASARADTPTWLIRSHSISIATSLIPRPTAGGTHRDGFLGVGAPALSGRPSIAALRGVETPAAAFGLGDVAALPPLPHAERELRAMGELFPAGERSLLTGAAATKQAFEARSTGRYAVMAFATHGLVADALPGLVQPALVLTPVPGGGPASDGLLTAGEIAELRLDADWVILSACDTAGGSDPTTASYSGLASAFLHAGARSLLVSHWPVRDDAAARITVATLAADRHGVDRAAALRRAMVALMDDRHVAGATNPAVWAPFVLVDR